MLKSIIVIVCLFIGTASYAALPMRVNDFERILPKGRGAMAVHYHYRIDSGTQCVLMSNGRIVHKHWHGSMAKRCYFNK